MSQLSELERSLSNSLLNLEASNAELEKFKLERAQLQAQLESVSVRLFMATIRLRNYFSFVFPFIPKTVTTVLSRVTRQELFVSFLSIHNFVIGWFSINLFSCRTHRRINSFQLLPRFRLSVSFEKDFFQQDICLVS